jgi:hypothetical protein
VGVRQKCRRGAHVAAFGADIGPMPIMTGTVQFWIFCVAMSR